MWCSAMFHLPMKLVWQLLLFSLKSSNKKLHQATHDIWSALLEKKGDCVVDLFQFFFLMTIIFLLLIPIIGVFLVCTGMFPNKPLNITYANANVKAASGWISIQVKRVALQISICCSFVSIYMFALFDYCNNQFQFVLESHEAGYFDFYIGLDGLSMYFLLLTAVIMPVSLLSNWTSISGNLKTYLTSILLLETLLLSVFLVLDILLFYVFFESILPPLFILIGSFGSSNRVRASFYLFLYTLWGSLFLLLSIVTMSSITGTTDFDALFKINFDYHAQLFIFIGVSIAFAVKTPVILLNSWLLKAHVESPLSGSIILAGIVLKLSLYGILRLILPLLPKAYINCTFLIYLIGVLTIVFASISTLRTIDVKELIAYSSVSHAAVYLMGVFSNTIQGIEGGITLGLAHGFVSSGLFICAGGVLYDRSSTRLITHYRGIAQMMPIFSVILFILCLGNCGVPLTLNFVGEFLSLYGAFERLPIMGALASSSIIFSAAYTIYMFNRIAFAGSYSKFFIVNISDFNKREFYLLLTLVLFTVALGVYPASVLDGLHYSVTTLIYSLTDPLATGLCFLATPLNLAPASEQNTDTNSPQNNPEHDEQNTDTNSPQNNPEHDEGDWADIDSQGNPLEVLSPEQRSEKLKETREELAETRGKIEHLKEKQIGYNTDYTKHKSKHTVAQAHSNSEAVEYEKGLVNHIKRYVDDTEKGINAAQERIDDIVELINTLL